MFFTDVLSVIDVFVEVVRFASCRHA